MVDHIRGIGFELMMLTAVMRHLEESGGDLPREDARALQGLTACGAYHAARQSS